jgi:hypothetical protein
MPVPLPVQRLLTEALLEMRHDPQHNVKPFTRLHLYDACGPNVNFLTTLLQQQHELPPPPARKYVRISPQRRRRINPYRYREHSSHIEESPDRLTGIDNTHTDITPTTPLDVSHLTDGFLRYAQLVLLTARFALPIWEQAMPDVLKNEPSFVHDFPHQLIAVAQGVLDDAAPHGEVDAALNKGYLSLGALPYSVTYDLICVAEAAYGALLAVLGSPPFTRLPRRLLSPETTDRDLAIRSGNWDVAWLVAQAVSAIDHDPIGADERRPIEYDVIKRRFFWEWWLTEAIPSVWEHES